MFSKSLIVLRLFEVIVINSKSTSSSKKNSTCKDLLTVNVFVFLLLEMMFLLQDSTFEINCCGIITAWEFYPCAPGVVQFMVWSLVSGTTYELKAIQEVHVTGR